MKVQEKKSRTSYLFYSDVNTLFLEISKKLLSKKCFVCLTDFDGVAELEKTKSIKIINEKESRNKQFDYKVFIQNIKFSKHSIDKNTIFSEIQRLSNFQNLAVGNLYTRYIVILNSFLYKELKEKKPNVLYVSLSDQAAEILFSGKGLHDNKDSNLLLEKILYSILSLGVNKYRNNVKILSKNEEKELTTKKISSRKKTKSKLKIKFLSSVNFGKRFYNRTNKVAVCIFVGLILPYLFLVCGLLTTILDKYLQNFYLNKLSIIATLSGKQISSYYNRIPILGGIYNFPQTLSYKLNTVSEINQESIDFENTIKSEAGGIFNDSLNINNKDVDKLLLLILSLKEKTEYLKSFDENKKGSDFISQLLSENSKYFYDLNDYSGPLYFFQQLTYFLGYKSEIKYLIISEDSDNPRPGGGIIKSASLLKIKDGKAAFEDDYSPNYLDSLQKGFILSSVEQQKYLTKKQNFENTSWENNLGDALISSKSYFESTIEEKTDAVIVVDNKAVDYFKLLQTSATGIRKFDTTNSSKMLNSFFDLLDNKDIYLYFEDTNIQDRLRQLGWGEGQRIDCDKCKSDNLFIYVSNLNKDDRTVDIDERINVSMSLQEKVVKKTVSINLINRSDSDQALYLGITSPLGTSYSDFSDFKNNITKIKPNLFSNQKSVEAGTVLKFNQSEEKDINISLETGKENIIGDNNVYYFVLRKQPGRNDIPTKVEIKTDRGLTGANSVLYNTNLGNDLLINYPIR